MRTRLLVSGTIGVLTAALTWLLLSRVSGGAGDFNWSYDAARALVSRQNPYAGTPPGMIPYPLPAALFALPFAGLSREVAGGVFFGVSSALLAFGLTKQGYVRLLVFLCYPYWAAMITAQWTPLLAASAFFPVCLPLTLAKPHIGLPLALTNLSRRGVLLSLGLLALTFAVMPSWFSQWLRQLGGYQHFFPFLIAPGFLLLLAALKYRDPDARLLLLASVVPQRWFYDPFILFLIPKTRRELVYTVALSWVPGVWRWSHNQHTLAQVGLWIVLWLYLPMLVVVLFRKKILASALMTETAPASL
jgi:hypothetical protein